MLLLHGEVPDLDRPGAVIPPGESRPRSPRTRADGPRRALPARCPASSGATSAPPTTRARRSAGAGRRAAGRRSRPLGRLGSGVSRARRLRGCSRGGPVAHALSLPRGPERDRRQRPVHLPFGHRPGISLWTMWTVVQVRLGETYGTWVKLTRTRRASGTRPPAAQPSPGTEAETVERLAQRLAQQACGLVVVGVRPARRLGDDAMDHAGHEGSGRRRA